MTRRNVLFLPAWYPTAEHPAAGVFIREHAKATALHHNVSVLHVVETNSQNSSRWWVASDQSEEEIRTVRVAWRPLPIPKGNSLFRLWVIWSAFRYMQRTGFVPDILHAHVCHMALPAVVLGRLYGIPVVISEHWSAFPLRQLSRRLLWGVRLAFSRAAMVLPVSGFLEQSIRAYGINGRFRVVPNTVNTKLFFPTSRGTEEGNAKSCPRALTVGLLSEPKGIPILLQAVREVQERRRYFHLDIVGDGSNRFEYEKISDNLGLEGIVTFHGLKSKPEVAKFMRNCDFFLQASLWETFGVTCVEAMACGKPIIGTQLPALKETITDEAGILVPPGDPMALAGAIQYMLDNYQSYSPQKISAYAHQRFGYEPVGEALDQVYREVLSPNRTV